MADKTVSKQLALTDTTNGHKFVGNDFGFSDFRFNYLYLYNVNTGTVSIKFGLTDDWVLLDLTTPFEFPLTCEEFYLKPSTANTVDCFVSLYGTGL